MRHARGHQAKTLQFVSCQQPVVVLFEVGYVDTTTYVADKNATGGETRNSLVEQPPILPICAAQPVLHLKVLARIECGSVCFITALQVLRINPRCPTVSKFFTDWPTGELEPALVEEGAELVCTRTPDHHGRSICHR